MAITDRKEEHLKICAKQNVQFREKSTGFMDVSFKDVELQYRSLPEIDRKKIDCSTEFFGKKFSAPLMVSAITGGIKKAEHINLDIAKACEELGIGMGLGSQRAMIENPALSKTFFVRNAAPSIFLAGNIGAVNLKDFSAKQIQAAVDSVKADALAVHLNAAQEACQHDGNTDFSNVLKELKGISSKLNVPVYAKEVGHGISLELAKALSRTGIKAIDVQGAGGTSWVAVDALRGNKELGETFWDIGIPTVVSLLSVKKAFNGKIISSGGIRSGFDIAKSMALGADLCAIGLPVYSAQFRAGEKGVKEYLNQKIEELKIAMFLCGAKNINELKKQKTIITGKTLEWLKQSGISF